MLNHLILFRAALTIQPESQLRCMSNGRTLPDDPIRLRPSLKIVAGRDMQPADERLR